MKTFTLIRTNRPDIRFEGEKLAEVQNSPYFNSRCEKLELYRSKGGKYLCQRISIATLPGWNNEYEGRVCDTLEEVIKFFGYGDLAKRLYREAGIDTDETIE